ncbi:MAG: hypothetical protein ACRD16_01310 [Thermoanaerobaculia bacterium]
MPLSKSRLFFLPFGAALSVLALTGVSCNNNDHGTTTANGSLAQVELGAPNGAVASGSSFNLDVKGRNLGFSVLHNSMVHVVLAPPLTVDSAEVTGGGGTVAFANGLNGATVDYSFGTIDKSSQSTGTIHAHGTLLSGQNNVTATITAQLTSDEVHAGDAVAQVNVLIQQ